MSNDKDIASELLEVLKLAVVFDDRRKEQAGGKPPTKGQWDLLMVEVRKAIAKSSGSI